MADAAPKKERHIFLLIGQSNMAGRATIEEADKVALPDAILWNIGEKKWDPAIPPYNVHSPSRKVLSMQKLNCGPSFAAGYLARNPGIEIGIVCVARGGSSIEQWDRENPDKFDLYRHAIEATTAALKDGGELKGILWHQGEANSGKFSEYPEKLKKLVHRFRHDLMVKDLPFVFGQIAPWNPAFQEFNQMIIKQPANIPHTGIVYADGLSKLDSVHFDSAAQRELGKRYATVMLEVLKKKR